MNKAGGPAFSRRDIFIAAMDGRCQPPSLR
jgi:hypothetical protein